MYMFNTTIVLMASTKTHLQIGSNLKMKISSSNLSLKIIVKMPLIIANDDALSTEKVSQHDNLRIVPGIVLPLMVL